MEKRFFLFILLASAAMLGNALLMSWLNPPAPPKPKVAQNQPEKPDEKANPKEDAKPAELKPAPNEPAPEVAQPKPAVAEAEPHAGLAPQWITLGSLDPKDPYRMLVTLTSRGAAVERIELNSTHLRELEEPGGYLGHLALEAAKGGVKVHAVGQGTPAAKAGLQPGDVIASLNGQPIPTPGDLRAALSAARPGQQIVLQVRRDDAEQSLTATLGAAPLQLIRPEGSDPLSLLLTLAKLDDREAQRDLGLETRQPDSGAGAQITRVGPENTSLRVGDVITHVDELEVENPARLAEILRTIPIESPVMLTVLREGKELKTEHDAASDFIGQTLRNHPWQVVDQSPTQVTFRWTAMLDGLEVVKRYRLANEEDQAAGRDYHLLVDVEIKNTSEKAHKVAYHLDGPTGLPIDGWWYANKISRDWGSVGVRDVAVWFRGDDPALISATHIISSETSLAMPVKLPLVYAGVDAQYVAAALLPQRAAESDLWFSEVIPLRVGPTPADKNRRRLVNTSFRLVSETQELAPGGALKHEYVFFAGPKRPELLARYELDALVYYGWFGFVAKPMLAILHMFYALIGNYGVAIIMLTVLVRGCMFPLSRKQAISAQKMQEIQPELKKLADKYKNNLEGRNKAQQELFKKHNYNPLGGCLLMFIQLPIFIGLYRSLMVDVELWQAPLIRGLQWCSNLAAPDMLFRWREFLPGFLADETGWLGPYFNLLPIFTIGLFLWQQKLFMPPPTDEQAAMQQKMIKYMMIFMGVMFFKVAAGLCLYFIASSLWGIAERKLLPKTLGPKKNGSEPEAATPRVALSGAGGNGATTRSHKKQRGGK